MAISHHQEQSPSSLLDALYCEEEQWEEEDEEQEQEERENQSSRSNGVIATTPSLLPILLLEQDLFWDDEELLSLFSKEEKQGMCCSKQGNFDISLSSIRTEAVEWMLKVNAHYGFCTLTSVLAVNYLDRFLSSFHLQKDKPWMFQLAAVTCLSLAAKVEETQVPLLVDLQVEETKYMFEAKTIQKMELLVLTTLDWKMNPVTPVSFLDHIIRRLGLKNHLHWEFLRRCERLLLSVLPDWRFVGYVPSVLATATMMHVIDQIEASNPLEYQNQLLGVLNFSKDKVKDCYQLMVETSSRSSNNNNNPNSSKRKYEDMMTMNTNNNMTTTMPRSPNGVMEAYYFSCDSSNDSWTATSNGLSSLSSLSSSSSSSSSVSSSVSSSPVMSSNNRKKGRVHEQGMTLQLPSLSRVFVDVIGSPR